jgi:hypothetical protein
MPGQRGIESEIISRAEYCPRTERLISAAAGRESVA